TSVAGDTVRAAHTADGQEWTCTVTPHDGREDGPRARATVTVGGTCPPSAGLDAAPGRLTVGYPLITVQVSPAGDVDGDGLRDALIGVSGAATLLRGARGPFEVALEAAGPRFTWDGDLWTYTELSADGAGDVNGDGYADLVIGGG